MRQFKGMNILKVGTRIGSKGLHAVVEYRGKYKLVMRQADQWIVILESRVHPLVRSHYLSELF